MEAMITNALIAAVSAMASIVLLIFLVILAFWQKDAILFLISGIVTILIGILWIDDYAGVMIVMAGMGVYQILKAIIMVFQDGGMARGLSQFRGMISKARGR